MTQKSESARSLVSLFTGAGGLDYGFEAAGFETRVALDFDHDSCETVRANRAWPVLEGDIHETTSQSILETSGLKSGDVDIVIGGPPCQPFSKAGYWANGDSRRLNDPRGRTLEEYMRVVDDLLPRVFVLENVHGIKYSGKEEGFLLLNRLTQRVNKRHQTCYRLSWKVINTADHGIPQIRQRFFLVASRDGKEFRFPSPTHGMSPPEQAEPGLFEIALNPWVTAWDAIGRLDPPDESEDLKVRGRWAELLPSIPEGENYLWHTKRKGGLCLFGWRTRYWSFLLKLAKDKPAWTIQAQPGPAIGPFHWKNRRLSVREMATLQTFPKDIKFIGNRLSIQRQLGNAVPSYMAEILGREIRKQLFGDKIPGRSKLEIPYNRPIPPPEKVHSVPTKFLHLVADHADHPGEGLGPSAENGKNLELLEA